MQNRRQFLKALSLSGGALALDFPAVFSSGIQNDYWGLNTFVENNPSAVFMLRTSVDAKTNTAAIAEVGRTFASSLFFPKSDPLSGIPRTSPVVLKPNLTWWSWDKAPIEDTMGIHTDPFFVEGIVGRLTDLTIPASAIHILEANYHGPDSIDGKKYGAMAARTGINLKDVSAGVGNIDAGQIQWVDVPNGTWFKKIPYLWPVNSGTSNIINIAKFKSHSMGITLCSKNLQGTIARPYVAHCTAWGTDMSGVDSQHIVPDAFATIKSNHERHVKMDIPRWDIPGDGTGGLWMETWASRCLDNNRIIKPLLNVIEGVYGREGPFVSGPDNGYGKDIMTNIIIFGKNSFHVDIIGTYLAGHEPGNFGLFHMAKEASLSSYVNPSEIPLFTWSLNGTATQAALSDFTRTPLRTLYLRKSGEDEYHMVNDEYNYTGVNAEPPVRSTSPDAFAIHQNYPNPFNPSTSIQFYIPSQGNVLLEIFDIRGSRVAVLIEGHLPAGDHLAVWNSGDCSSGTYLYRLLYNGHAVAKTMTLLR